MADSGIGYWFEDKTRAALDKLRASDEVFYHRWPDSHAAGRFLPTAPADFLVGCNGRALLLECKASVKAVSLRGCLASMVDDDQVGSHRLWHLAGLDSWFLFYSERLGQVEMWQGWRVVKARHGGIALTGQVDFEFGLDEMVEFLPELFR